MKLYCVHWKYYQEGEKFYSRIMTSHTAPGHVVFEYKFFDNEAEAVTLFEKIKDDPPCDETIMISIRELVLPKSKEGVVEVLNELVDYSDGVFNGLRFDEEKHRELREHAGFQYSRLLQSNTWG